MQGQTAELLPASNTYYAGKENKIWTETHNTKCTKTGVGMR